MLVVRPSPGEDAAGDPPTHRTPSIIYRSEFGNARAGVSDFPTHGPVLTDIPLRPSTNGTIVEDAVYAIEPDLSHVSRAFAEQDQEFLDEGPDDESSSQSSAALVYSDFLYARTHNHNS